MRVDYQNDSFWDILRSSTLLQVIDEPIDLRRDGHYFVIGPSKVDYSMLDADSDTIKPWWYHRDQNAKAKFPSTGRRQKLKHQPKEWGEFERNWFKETQTTLF